MNSLISSGKSSAQTSNARPENKGITAVNRKAPQICPKVVERRLRKRAVDRLHAGHPSILLHSTEFGWGKEIRRRREKKGKKGLVRVL
jgi:hypothetical protein